MTALHLFFFACTALVIVGVALEGWQHVRELRAHGWRAVWRHGTAEQIGFTLLVLGLGGELLFGVLITKADSETVARLNNDAANARLEEQRLRAANLKLREEVQRQAGLIDQLRMAQEYTKGQISILAQGGTAKAEPLAANECKEKPTAEACGVPSRASLVPCNDPLAMVPEQIWEEQKSLTAYEQTERWTKYEGVCVEWTKPLKGMKQRGDFVEVYLGAGRIGLLTVATRARLADYPEIKLLKAESPVTVRGRIVFVQSDYIAVGDATLSFPSSEPAPASP